MPKVYSILDIHARFIASVAFRLLEYPRPTWDLSRRTAQDALLHFFTVDGEDIVKCMLRLAMIAHGERKRLQKRRPGKEIEPANLVRHTHRASIRRELWAESFALVSSSNAMGLASLMQATAPFSHIEKLDRRQSWSHTHTGEVNRGDRPKIGNLGEAVSEPEWSAAIRNINLSLSSALDPLARVVTAFAMDPNPSARSLLWEQANVARSAIILLLSPIDDVHNAMMTLLQQSFEDVDDRTDCFRALLSRFPSAAMDGLTSFLSTFIETATITPESCSLAKWLVRCFTDVLDVLCRSQGSSEALLQSPAFLTTSSDGRNMNRRLKDLWHLMSTALAVIFKRTTAWAPLYDNETMVDWMRDALIFGRQMADQIRTFESAASVQLSNGSVNSLAESPANVMPTGRKLVDKLEIFLVDLVGWLRLTE